MTNDWSAADRARAELPSSLTTRTGWAEYFEAQRTREPHLHQIEPTNSCPFSCIMCPRPRKMSRPVGLMELGLFEKVIDEVAGYGEPVRSKEIELFHFGESLLHPHILAMVGHGTARGLNLVLSVNAQQLVPSLAEGILGAGPGKLILSLDGHDQQSLRQIRGENADYAAAAANVEALIEIHQKTEPVTEIELRMIQLKANMGGALEFKRHWEERGIKVELREFFPWNDPGMVDLGHYETYLPNMPCPFPWQHLVVQWNGDVVPCCRDYDGQNRLGNVRDQTLKEIWNGPECEGLRHQMELGEYGGNTVCEECMSIYLPPAEEVPEAAPDRWRRPDLEEDDLAALWRRAALRHGERIYLVDDSDGSLFSYGDADSVIGALCHRMGDAGLAEGSRIVVWAPVHVESVLLFWAAMASGAVFVPLDPQLPPHQALQAIDRIQPALVVVDGERFSHLSEPTELTVLVLDGDGDHPRGATCVSEWLRDEDYGQPGGKATDHLASQPAVILMTSGTTGDSKGVVLSHRALAHSGRLMARCYGLGPDDVLFAPGDLHTMSGLRNPVVATAEAGASAVVASTPVRANPLSLMECTARNRVTVLTVVPAALRQLVAVSNRADLRALSALRMVLSTAAALPQSLRADFAGIFGAPLYNYYGLTETAGLCAAELPGRTRASSTTIGHPVDAVFRVVDEDGRDVVAGEAGELWVASTNLMLGYLDDPEATAQAFEGPFFRTGDLARRNLDGSYSLRGRIREIIKNARGEIVSPTEIEEALLAHLSVADAGVCPTSDEMGQEQLHAFVVATGDQPAGADGESWIHELRHYLLGRLGPHRMPARLQATGAIPRNSNGKVRVGQLLALVEAP